MSWNKAENYNKVINYSNREQCEQKAVSLLPHVSGKRHIVSCFRKQLQLAKVLFSNIPASHIRATECSIDYDNTVAITACLRKRIRSEIIGNISSNICLPSFAHEQLMAILKLPCWRHMIRLDSKGGVGLYIERDWNSSLLYAISHWFSSPAYLIKKVLELVETKLFVTAFVGIHWKNNGETRFRVYTVSIAPRILWNTYTPLLLDSIESSVEGFVRPVAEQLLKKPRRACVVNWEGCAHGIGIKLEIPDIRWTEIGVGTIFRIKKSIKQTIETYSGSSLRYIGVRFKPGQEPNTTLYFPFSKIKDEECGLLI